MAYAPRPATESKPHETQGCSCFGLTASVIFLALTIIGIIGGILCILAQHGWQIGVINNLATMIPEHLLYLGFAGISLLFPVSILLLVAQVKSNNAERRRGGGAPAGRSLLT